MGSAFEFMVDVIWCDLIDKVRKSIGDHPPAPDVRWSSCRVHKDGCWLVDGHATGSIRREIGIEDDDPSGATQPHGNRRTVVHRDLKQVWSAIGEAVSEESRGQTNRSIKRWALRNGGSKFQELVAMTDRSGVRCGSKLPHARGCCG